MDVNEVLACLCSYDPRNPDFNPEYSEEREPGVVCYCDNCFYGRHEMAVEIIRLREQLQGKGGENE